MHGKTASFEHYITTYTCTCGAFLCTLCVYIKRSACTHTWEHTSLHQMSEEREGGAKTDSSETSEGEARDATEEEKKKE